MIESYVDLTYRGLSLGRRLRLTQIRPSTGFVELPTPMPVGTQISITTDDGEAFDATVTWIHEQVAGADRAPGMIVAPALTGAAAAAWWTSRVSLPDEEAPTHRIAAGRARPVTVRPRSRTNPTPPPAGVATVEPPMIAADLAARVTAAAGLEPPRPAEPTIADALLLRTAEHDVIDDGTPTVIMASVDPASLGLDAGASGTFRHSDTADDDDTVSAGAPHGPGGNAGRDGGAKGTSGGDGSDAP